MEEIMEITETDKIQKYERTNIFAYKAKNGKSITIPISKELFTEESSRGNLILNVSVAGLQKFLTEENWKKFGLNKIREI